jgi:hypothetical protein
MPASTQLAFRTTNALRKVEIWSQSLAESVKLRTSASAPRTGRSTAPYIREPPCVQDYSESVREEAAVAGGKNGEYGPSETTDYGLADQRPNKFKLTERPVLRARHAQFLPIVAPYRGDRRYDTVDR